MKIRLITLVALIAAAPAYAQQQKTVDGIVVNIGIVPAAQASQYPAEVEAHGKARTKGLQHLTVSLSDAQTGANIKDAEVRVELDDPTDALQSKKLARNTTAGMVDHSEYFRFDMPGRYFINIFILPKGRTAPIKVQFTRDYTLGGE